MSISSTSPAAIPLVVLAGPTATGKSRLALELASAFELEIVGADSVQLYRGLDIGSGKVSTAERARVPHHLIDVVDPDATFTAGDYLRAASEAIEAIWARRRVALVTGGTGLYLRALLYGLSEMPEIPAGVRETLHAELETRGLAALRAELEAIDPRWAARVDANDRQRILRGLEVYRASGKTLSAFQEEDRPQVLRYRAFGFVLDVGVDRLRRAIEERVDEMLAAGFVAEVRALLERGYGPALKSMQSLGYRQICEHLAGALTLAEARGAIIREHQRYAKRQRTWFRKMPELVWLPPEYNRLSAQLVPFLEAARAGFDE